MIIFENGDALYGVDGKIYLAVEVHPEPEEE